MTETRPPVTAPLACPKWCVKPHAVPDPDDGLLADVRTHHADSTYVDLAGYPDGFAVVGVVQHDLWSSQSREWTRERPFLVITPGTPGTAQITIWTTAKLRPLLALGPLLIPGLLDLVLDAARLCGIKIPEVPEVSSQ